mmetsp:Transcript_53921/g.130981  ORF Transcript_53921/g.130981 Transcript_53921/m.130981 type:complete len:157 (-) Transcript_53921:111-581(-)|eukprot:CAMPEP_0113445054 /NCGR_PEP_ID=MMETSP0014_2-20120614/2986_1 /TAXON_ID=2857 /ORGANISM="Nitzschia sp." /LENGTH=156 /DNA_ID=CAMNT_0000336089 /DNA_START=68 /DNA_END=538 /DNA_ORIENTATION=+ /assembly_acc=CAM_ASM_000159
MGKIYTIAATILALLEFSDFVNLCILGGHVADPRNNLTTYNDLPEETQDVVIMMANWVGVAKLYYGFFCLSTALSSEYKVRLLGALGAVFTTYMSFFTLLPAMAQYENSNKTDGPMNTDTMKVVMGLVIGPVFMMAAFAEYREMNQAKANEASKMK